jgi:glycosyltransferase involved in cell wall biosynthesis
MRIGINSLFLKPGQVGGAEFVLRGLLIGLAQIPDVDLYVFFNRELTMWLDNLGLGTRLNIIPISVFGNRFISEAIQVPIIANRYNLDGLIHANYFTPWRSLMKMPCATIIYDLNYLHFPHLFSWRKKLWLRTTHQITLANADTIVAISQFVQQDINKNYRPSSQIVTKVIPIPILWDRISICTPPATPIKYPFILSVANHYQHKNLATLLYAFQKISYKFADINLVLVGQLPDALLGMRRDRCDDIPTLVEELGLQDRVRVTGHISDAELAWYYHHAEMFAFPSLFEGFGMPPVEALGMGLPTLTTRCTAIPEATLNLAHYVDDPLNVDEWSDRIAEILRDRNDFLPTQDAISQIREVYDPVTISRKYVNLFRAAEVG